MILRGTLGDGTRLQEPDTAALDDGAAARAARVEQSLRRRLERMREPKRFHPITPRDGIATGLPPPEPEAGLGTADPATRAARRRDFDRALRRKLAKNAPPDGLAPRTARPPAPAGMQTGRGNLKPTDFPGRPDTAVRAGDTLAGRARKLYSRRKHREAPEDKAPR
jgi:hypothetical protein